MDPLSDVLSLLKPQSQIASGFDVAGDWSIRFAQHDGIKCYALATGRCWLVLEGEPEPIRVEAGDCFLLTRGLPFCLTTDLSLTPIEASTIYTEPARGQMRVWNGGGELMGLGGYFRLAGPHARLLLDELPPIVHIRSEPDKEQLRWLLERMRQEVQASSPGSSLVTDQLAMMMLVLALRLHVAEGRARRAGWLFALADCQMNAAMTAIHEQPGAAWTLESLAERCGMSRSIFALRFKAKVGTSPMEYLTRWRMLLAGERLARSDEAIGAIANSVGYASQSAFGKAFRKVMGSSPLQHRREHGRTAVA